LDIQAIRDEFPALRNYAWFQNGGVSITPKCVAAAYARLMNELLERGPLHIVYPDEEYPRTSEESIVSENEIRLQKLTRREFREAMEAGKFQACIIPTGAIEQHLEHLAMEHDFRSACCIAEEVASQMYPHVIVTAPMSFGISEHHMIHKGTVSAKPGSWLSALFDAIESMLRHGCRNVLIVNGHGGNEAPVYGMLRQWQLYFRSQHPQSNVQFHSYWNLSRADAEAICETGVPGHAQEYETSMALHLFPENVRRDAMNEQEDQLPLKATAEKGKAFFEAAVQRTSDYLQRMIDGKNREIRPHLMSWQLDLKAGAGDQPI
jgi:creatinine amidohydrolase